MEGLTEAVSLTEAEIDMVSRAASRITEDSISLQTALEDSLEWGDQHSSSRLRSAVTSATAQLFPELEGTSPSQGGMEGFAERILKALWG